MAVLYILLVMNEFDENYAKYVEVQYGDKRDPVRDASMIASNDLLLPHAYTVSDRVDMTNIDVYSVDPVGCEDADDAFSVYTEFGRTFLAIHIADPTEFISMRSDLWLDIENKVITMYPSNTKPVHMMPHEIMERASLMDNGIGCGVSCDGGCVKNAITVLTEISCDTFLPINRVKLLFTHILAKKRNTMSYESASRSVNSVMSLEFGLKIGQAMQEMRGKKTIGVKLKSVDKSIIDYACGYGGPRLRGVSPNETMMMQMIEEFAIFANSFVGEYLSIHLGGNGIFRACDASAMTGDEFSSLSGNELLHHIITNGIRADYMNTVASHDLVGSREYTHFTSPIRRASDCVCHYLLKYLYLREISGGATVVPFDSGRLAVLAERCDVRSKKMKKVQYTDTKYRLIQVMHGILHRNGCLEIEYCVTGHIHGFVNIIIKRVDEFPVYLSYSLRRKSYDGVIDNKLMFTLQVGVINCRERFDEGSIPELDARFV